MNLHYRLESAGRTRFLLALTLSTLTALGVAAPLAMQAVRADEATFASGDATSGPAVDNRDDLKAEVALNRSLSDDGSVQRGGIQASEDTSKATGRTTKAESVEPIPAEEEPATESVLTNPEPEPVEAEPITPEEPVTETSAPATTTTVEDTSTSSTETTVEDTSTSSTETTVEDTSTSSTETTTTSSTVIQGETPPTPAG